MGIYYSIYIQRPSNPEKLSSVCKALGIFEENHVSVSEDIMKLSYISSNTYASLQQLFPIKSAIFSDEEYEDYKFSEEEKELISLFLKDTPFIIYGHDCNDSLTLCTTKDYPVYFSDIDLNYWEDATPDTKERLRKIFKNANINFEAFLSFFKGSED